MPWSDLESEIHGDQSPEINSNWNMTAFWDFFVESPQFRTATLPQIERKTWKPPDFYLATCKLNNSNFICNSRHKIILQKSKEFRQTSPWSAPPNASFLFNFCSILKWGIVKGRRTCQKQTFILRKRCKIAANIFYSFLPTLSVRNASVFSYRLVQTMSQSRSVWKFRNHIRITFALKSIEKL